jgi:hypothetical protein
LDLTFSELAGETEQGIAGATEQGENISLKIEVGVFDHLESSKHFMNATNAYSADL